MAKGSDRLPRLEEMLHRLNHFGIQAKIFRRSPSWYDERVIGREVDVGEGRVEGEVVAALFAIGLLPLEIVDCGRDLLAGLFARANRMNLMAHRKQGLEWHHHLIVFAVIAANHQDALAGHSFLLAFKDALRGLSHGLPDRIKPECDFTLRCVSPRSHSSKKLVIGATKERRRAEIMESGSLLKKPESLASSFDKLRMRLSVFNELILMVSLSNHGQYRFSAAC
jgi:hypothetical protein